MQVKRSLMAAAALTLLAITAHAASPIPLCLGGNGKTRYYVKDNQRGEPM
jgi:hypothetical protein